MVFCQFNHDFVWLNGDVGFVEDPENPNIHLGGINQLNFNNEKLNITRDYRDSDFYLMNASISSKEGELLFYTNGCNVFQADGEVMENGDGLNPGFVYLLSGHCPDNGSPVSNGALILPLPESDSMYYIFHKALELGDGVNLGVYNATVYALSLIHISEPTRPY